MLDRWHPARTCVYPKAFLGSQTGCNLLQLPRNQAVLLNIKQRISLSHLSRSPVTPAPASSCLGRSSLPASTRLAVDHLQQRSVSAPFRERQLAVRQAVRPGQTGLTERVMAKLLGRRCCVMRAVHDD